MIQFGKYDQKVSFIQYGTTSDGYGGTVPVESVALATYARSIQVKGSNDLEQAQLGLPKTYNFGVQWRTGFNPNVTMTIRYKGFDHVIKAVEEATERNVREWIITAVRGNELKVNELQSILQIEL